MDSTRQKALVIAMLVPLMLAPLASHAIEEKACAPRISQEQALKDISEWTLRMKQTDARYLKVEDVLLKHVDYVINSMPAQYWLPTLQLMYGAAADAAGASKAPAFQRF